MGEKVEEKKVKVKKPREKIEKSKGEKRERSRRSVEKELEDQDDEEESVEDVDKQEEENLKPVNNIRNKFVDDDLVAFKNNFYLVTPGKSPLSVPKLIKSRVKPTDQKIRIFMNLKDFLSNVLL